MSIRLIHLRKLLKLMFADEGMQTSELRADIRAEIAREQGTEGGGGDFHMPFWADARRHVFNEQDLHDAVEYRIERNARRARLYPLLRDGFLQWWNERRRWTNEPFAPFEAPHSRIEFEDLGTAKIENLLAVRDAANDDHLIYPYFAERPILNENAARLGLWLMGQALPEEDPNEMRILDTLRGRTYSLDRSPLQGNEELDFITRYEGLIDRWLELWNDY